MASNTLPLKQDKLFTLGDDNLKGLAALETTVGVKQNTLAVISAALAAARTAEAAYGTTKVEKKAANAELNEADKAGRRFIMNSRTRLAKFLGEAYSTEWGAVGWPNNATSVPTTQEERYNLVKSLETYFTANPSRESVDLDATAAIATAAAAAIIDARALLGVKITKMGEAKVARDKAVDHLRLRMDGLVTELDTLLTDDDPRWHTFGLNRPADENTPETPTFTTLLASVAGTALVDWDDALRAERYRVWIMIVGVDTDFRVVETVYDSDATLTGLPSGSTVKVRVTSVNEAGESLPGPVAELVVP